MPQYGLISKTDASVIEKTIDLIIDREFIHHLEINVTEVGLYNCQTSISIRDYILSKGRHVNYTGIDNQKDKPINPPEWMNFILGDSSLVYNKIKDYSQHMIFIDGLHTYPAVVSDFFCYMNKVHYDGFILFHDTGKHLDPLSGYQGVGDKDDHDFCLGGVRKALKAIGLLSDNFKGWVKKFEAADPDDTGGGIVCLQRM